jgi:GTP-binding protein HflX
VIFSDTVGFISDLPTQLVAAFRATLEEVMLAEIILHVRDISHPDTAIQARDVAQTLSLLGVDPETDDRVIEVWNKIDLVPDMKTDPDKSPLAISALTGQGLDVLLHRIEERLAETSKRYRVRIPSADGKLVAWLHEHVEVLERKNGEGEDDIVEMTLRVSPERADSFRSRAGDYIVRVA